MKIKLSPFLLLCIMGGLAIFSSTMAKNPVLPLFIRSLEVPISVVGFIAAASTLVGIVVSLPAGVLSDVIGHRRVILIAAVIFATAPFLYLLVTVPWQLVMVRIYHGLATAILGPVAMAAVADTFDEKRGERMGWYSSTTMVGRFMAPFVGGALIFGDDFHWVFLATGTIGVLSLATAFRLSLYKMPPSSAGEPRKPEHGNIRKDIIAIVAHRGILATSVIEAVQYFAFGCLEVFLPIYLHEQAGFSTLWIGLLFTVQIVVATLTKPVMGHLSDRHGRRPLITAGLVLGGIAMALITCWQNYLVIVFLAGLFGLGLATVTAASAALVADLSPSSRHGSALGVLASVMDIGHATGPIVGGLLIAVYNYGTAFGIVGAGVIVAGLVFWPFTRGISSVPEQRHTR
jgi:DHA1 family multidrug resistance protein-like MFS transporter